jgi:homogentisate 1,2-dioxygenase
VKVYKRFGKVADRPHLNLPKDTFEEELGLDGFFGPVSHLYHRNPPTAWSKIEKSNFQWLPREEAPELFLKPQCFKDVATQASGDFFKSHRLLFWNEDIAISIHRVTSSNPVYFRNADASEVFFCHEGKAQLESPFGTLEVKTGDYVSVPRGVTYRWNTKSAYLLRIESYKSRLKKPETGILGQQALYHEEGIQCPSFKPNAATDKSSRVRVQKDLRLTEITYPFDIRRVAGWIGTLYPFVLSVKDIAPVLSSIAHLPPSVNATFVTPEFIVCTFLPRPLEEPAGALKVPFFHSNIDYDEVILYHAGDFFSRDHMEKGYITLHPRGINHGPHPKALKNQHSKTRTEEVGIMIDTLRSLKVSKFARSLELPDYWKSWRS